MKIIITGATGSLGAALTRYFANQGHEIIATGQTGTPPEKLKEPATYIRTDISTPYSLPDADVCIHAAALSDDKGKNRDLYNANVIGTENTLNAAKNCKTFIHISSSSVYMPSDKPLPETVAGKQNNKQLSPYGYSKLQAEQKLMDTSEHERCFVLRPRALYGPFDKVILPRLFKLESHGKLNKPGKMEVNVSMTHYDNIIHAVECCLASDKKGINIYNVSDDEVYKLIGVLRKLTATLYEKELPEKHIPIGLLKAMAVFKINGITPLLIRTFTKDMVLDISKIKNELGYCPKTNLDNSLEELKKWTDSIGGIEVLKTGDKKLAWI